MTVFVIAGGLSHERDVSLRSGRRLAFALRECGLQVQQVDLNGSLLSQLAADSDPVAIPMLHGGLGEDGALREVLQALGVPFVGSDAASSRRTFDKSIATRLVAAAGLATPRQIALPDDIFRELGAEGVMQAAARHLGFPMMVKPARSGSALGAAKVDHIQALPAALVGAFAYGKVAILEEYVVGTELSVTVIDTDTPVALPPVEIHPSSGIYDYEARYTPGMTQFITPANLPEEVLDEAKQLAVRVHHCLGMRDISRTDMIVRDGVPLFLEGNVAPGMTETSLVPLAAEAAEIELGPLFAELVAKARARG